MMPHHLITGWDDAASPMSFMRFRWVAEEVNKKSDLKYELYKPWRQYDAVVFLKSMGSGCERLMKSLQVCGTRVFFEANVDYYSDASSNLLPLELAPTITQRVDAIAMTAGADAIIASSRRLAEMCSRYSKRVFFVPDNIPAKLIPQNKLPLGAINGRLNLVWSGMAPKMFDFLLIADVLKKYRNQIHLHFITGDFTPELLKWPEGIRHSMRELLNVVPNTFHPFSGIINLLKTYHRLGGVVLSPRYMESAYNQSHTEWKLTLGLACGLFGLGSPLPSYEDASCLTSGEGLRICRDLNDWDDAFDKMIANPMQRYSAGLAGANPVLARYGSENIAREHASIVQGLLS